MSNVSRREYLFKIKSQYNKSTKLENKQMLDEFYKVCDYNHKYAIILLNRKSFSNNYEFKTRCEKNQCDPESWGLKILIYL